MPFTTVTCVTSCLGCIRRFCRDHPASVVHPLRSDNKHSRTHAQTRTRRCTHTHTHGHTGRASERFSRGRRQPGQGLVDREEQGARHPSPALPCPLMLFFCFLSALSLFAVLVLVSVVRSAFCSLFPSGFHCLPLTIPLPTGGRLGSNSCKLRQSSHHRSNGKRIGGNDDDRCRGRCGRNRTHRRYRGCRCRLYCSRLCYRLSNCF